MMSQSDLSTKAQQTSIVTLTADLSDVNSTLASLDQLAKTASLYNSQVEFFVSFILLLLSRHCTSGAVYESTKITNKLLDANTLYQLDKYSKYVLQASKK